MTGSRSSLSSAWAADSVGACPGVSTRAHSSSLWHSGVRCPRQYASNVAASFVIVPPVALLELTEYGSFPLKSPRSASASAMVAAMGIGAEFDLGIGLVAECERADGPRACVRLPVALCERARVLVVALAGVASIGWRYLPVALNVETRSDEALVAGLTG
jgi:hypothetical protein